MASIQKRKDKYNVIYYYTDKYGKVKQKWESFRTLREARKRKAEVEKLYRKKKREIIRNDIRRQRKARYKKAQREKRLAEENNSSWD